MGIARGGGTNLGAAQGSITINTTQAQQAVPAMQQVAAGINAAMAGVNTSTNKASAGFGALAGSVRGLAGAFGIGLGVGTVKQLAQAAVAAEELATAYERQNVAARGLAGSQGQLNDLLDAYERATGGAVDQATALQSVTKLMAVGFGDSSEELEQFARAIRGISLAMGTSQDTVTQNLILELFTQRGARLDQLGLQYDKVRQRADELQAADRTLTSQMAYQQAVLEQAEERFGKIADSTEGAATETERLKKAWADLRLEMAQEIKPNVEEATGALNDLLELLNRVREAHADLTQQAISRRAAEEGRIDPFGTLGSRTSIGRVSPESFGISGAGPSIIEGQAKAELDWAKGVQDINKRLHDDIIDAETDYGRQRADTIRNYQKGLAREERDFQRNRLRAELEQLDAIADVWKEATRREAKAAADLARSLGQARIDADERIADAREDSNKRLAELDEDFQEDREKAARKHADDLMDAAGNLNAQQVYELQRDFALQEKEAKESHDEQRKELTEALQERIDDEEKALAKSNQQAREAYDRQLADAREADRIRVEDMKADFAERKEQEDADRAIRLSDLAQDHADQLAEQDRAHGARIQQINDHAKEEREALDLAHKEEMIELGVRNDKWLQELERMERARRRIYDEVWNPSSVSGLPPGATLPSNNFRSNGAIPPANYNPVPNWQNSGRTSSTNVGGISINVYGAPGQSEERLGMIVEERIIEVLERGAN